MRSYLSLFAERLSPNARRILIVLAAAGLALYARATADAWADGDTIDLVAGGLLTTGFATVSALLWSLRRSSMG